MKRAALGWICGTLVIGLPALSHAGAAFDEHGPGIRQRPAEQLIEASCDVDVVVRGAVASVELRQRIANPGPDALGASLELELPRGGQVVGLSLRGDGGVEQAVAVDRLAQIVAATPGIDGVDPALLVRTDAGYQVILQPIAPDHDAVITTRYAALAEARGGGLRLVLPGRSSAGKLAPCRGTVRALPGPGATVRRIRVAGVEGAHGASFVLDAQDVAIHVELEIPGKLPVVWMQSQPLSDGWSASLVTVLGPPHVTGIVHRRVVMLIDGSRSMDLVGRHNVLKVVERVGAALPANAEVEAIVYDRTASRVFGAPRPPTADNLRAIADTVRRRGASNGSDLVGALALAKQAIAGARGQAMLILITDGVTGDLDGGSLTRALGEKTSTVDFHAIVVDPGATRAPGAAALRAPVNLYGGAYIEVAADELDDALAAIDDWLRPSWLELELAGHAIPTEVRAGGGFAQPILHRGALAATVTGHGEAPFAIAARPAPAAPIAALALAGASAADFTGAPDPTEPEVARAQPIFERALAAQPFASATQAFAVLATAGRIAKSRRAVVAGGGRYERVTALADPVPDLAAAPAPAAPGASAIARSTLERLFREQLQPKAFACYQRALGRNPKLAGMTHFQLRMGRGEVTEVTLVGLGDPQLDGCLLDAAYTLTPPLPDFAINADDQTIANYPLTFSRREDQAVIVLGDADSTSPLDIDAIQAGVPGERRRPIKLDPASANTPLGNLRPSKTP